MTVPNQTPYKEYTANGTTSKFTLGFYVTGKDNIVVKMNGSLVASVLYTYNPLDNSVSFNTPPKAGTLVAIARYTVLERTTQYKTSDNSFRPDTVNYDFDRVWYSLQEFKVRDDQHTNSLSEVTNLANQAIVKADGAIVTANNANDKADQAISTANLAKTTAVNADNKANTAISTANTAKNTADDAKVVANNANSTANTAIITSNNAKNIAEGLDGKIELANTTANNANNTAITAYSNSITAINTADGAKRTADMAIDVANTSNTIAREARNTANVALNTANGVDAKAEQAISTANTALTTANNANTTAIGIDAKATQALNNSSNALNTANAAKVTADGVDAKATEALTNSAEALSKSNTALTTANAVDTKASKALVDSAEALELANDAKNKTFFSAYGKLDIYQDKSTEFLYRNLDLLPVGSRALINSGMGVLNMPVLGGEFAYIETISTYNDSGSVGKKQEATGYNTNVKAYRVTTGTSEGYGAWTYIANTNSNTASASKLQQAREINGIGFDGTKDIRINKLVMSHSYLTDANNPSGGPAESVMETVDASYTANLPAGNYGYMLQTTHWTSQAFNAQLLYGMGDRNGMFYRGRTNGAYTGWREFAFVDSNVATATKLQNTRKINGINFDGTKDIMVYDDTKVPKAGGIMTGSLNVADVIYCDSLASRGDVSAYSDIRLKDHIQPIDSAMDKVSKLNGVTFTRNDIKDDNDRRYVGLIAQDVLNAIPEAISEVNDLYAVNYQGLVGLLVEAIKELNEKVEKLNGTTK